MDSNEFYRIPFSSLDFPFKKQCFPKQITNSERILFSRYLGGIVVNERINRTQKLIVFLMCEVPTEKVDNKRFELYYVTACTKGMIGGGSRGRAAAEGS